MLSNRNQWKKFNNKKYSVVCIKKETIFYFTGCSASSSNLTIHIHIPSHLTVVKRSYMAYKTRKWILLTFVIKMYFQQYFFFVLWNPLFYRLSRFWMLFELDKKKRKSGTCQRNIRNPSLWVSKKLCSVEIVMRL